MARKASKPVTRDSFLNQFSKIEAGDRIFVKASVWDTDDWATVTDKGSNAWGRWIEVQYDSDKRTERVSSVRGIYPETTGIGYYLAVDKSDAAQ